MQGVAALCYPRLSSRVRDGPVFSCSRHYHDAARSKYKHGTNHVVGNLDAYCYNVLFNGGRIVADVALLNFD